MDQSEELKKYSNQVLILSVVGLPFFLAFVLGALAYFKGNVIIPVLADETVAFYTFVVGAVGAAMDTGANLYIKYKIKTIQNANT